MVFLDQKNRTTPSISLIIFFRVILNLYHIIIFPLERRCLHDPILVLNKPNIIIIYIYILNRNSLYKSIEMYNTNLKNKT